MSTTTNTLPEFSTYGDYASDNYGAHALRFDIGRLTIYFSYRTPVAFRHNGRLHVRQNTWGPTTGKHLNWIDGGNKAGRISGAEFEELLSKAINTPAR